MYNIFCGYIKNSADVSNQNMILLTQQQAATQQQQERIRELKIGMLAFVETAVDNIETLIELEIHEIKANIYTCKCQSIDYCMFFFSVVDQRRTNRV